MDDPVLAHDFEIVVDLPDILVEATGEIPDALGRSVHQTSHQLQAARRDLCRSTHAQNASKSRAPDCSAIDHNVPVSMRSCIGTLTTRTSSSLVGCSYRSLT